MRRIGDQRKATLKLTLPSSCINRAWMGRGREGREGKGAGRDGDDSSQVCTSLYLSLSSTCQASRCVLPRCLRLIIAL